jgi:hypothetical protein
MNSIDIKMHCTTIKIINENYVYNVTGGVRGFGVTKWMSLKFL